MSIDWSENITSLANMELTCQGGASVSSCAYCPCVAKRRWNVAFDGEDLVGSGMKSEAFAFISSEDFVKDPDATVHFVKHIVKDQRARQIKIRRIILDMDNCSAHYKCG